MKQKVVMAVTNDLRFDNRVRKEAASLVQAGFTVVVICKRSPATPPDEYFDGVQVKRIDLEPYPRSLAEKLKILWSFINVQNKILYRVLVDERGDIYHAHDLETLLPVGQASAKLGRPFVYDVHDLKLDVIRKRRSSTLMGILLHPIWMMLYASLERYWIKRASGVITTNRFYAAVIQRRYQIPAPTLVTNCPPYVNLAPEKIRNLRQHFSLPTESTIILYQGGLGESRGILIMVDALPLLATSYHFVIIGEGKMQTTIQARAQARGVADRVHFHPLVPASELLFYTAGADIGLLLIEDQNISKRYTAPNKLFEYMMAGLPMLASNMPYIAEVVHQTGSGMVIEGLDPHSVAKAAETMVRSSELHDMRRRALEASHDRYNWEQESQKLVALYQHVAHG